MKQKPNSPKKRPSLRLVDSSIWIACNRIGHLQLLVNMPDIGISHAVHGELRGGRDNLASKTQALVVNDITDMLLANDNSEATTLLYLIQDKDGISRPDAEQAVYVRLHPEACLYMRDTDAQIAALRGGGDVRDHRQLVADMQEEGIVGEGLAKHLLEALDDYFSPGRKGRGSKKRRG